jgi:TPR repeat protein
MVLLTDQNAKAQSQALAAPTWAKEGVKAESATTKNEEMAQESPSESKLTGAKIIAATVVLGVALFAGWYVNQAQQSGTTQLSVSEEAIIDPVTSEESITEQPTTSTNEAEQVTQASLAPDEAPDNVLDYSDEQLMEALNNDAEGLATQLNAIEPGAVDPQEEMEKTAAVQPTPTIMSLDKAEITAPMKNFDAVAFKQDPQIQKAVQSERSTAPLLSRLQPDSQLPASVKQVEAQAFKGNAEAQHDLAAIYTAGHAGVDQNFDKAAFWFREASESDIANARYNLGVLYHQGLGRDRNLDRALYWYREAAKLNHAEAQYNLGIAHIEGIGTEYNPRLAAAFFERAANNGIMEAAYNLGLIYENGLLGESNTNEALMWYKIAADQGSQDAKLAMQQLAANLQIDMQDIDKLVERMQQINESAKGRRAGPSVSAKTSDNTAEQRRSMIAQIQEYLMLNNMYAGPADGIIGPQTEEAIREYQSANNLDVNGKVSESLLSHMVNSAVAKLNANQ